MPIFGQVWLWSLAAFLLGALLCWVLVVLPVRRRIDSLESRLSSLRTDARLSAAAERTRAPESPAGASQGLVPGFGDPDGNDEIRAETLTRAYALPGVRETPTALYGEPGAGPDERGALQLSAPTTAEPVAPGSFPGAAQTEPRTGGPGRDWFDEQPAATDEPAGSRRHAIEDDDDEEDRGTVFTQRTTPIPAALIRSLDDSERETGAHRQDESLVDDLAGVPSDGERSSAATTVMPAATPPVASPPAPEPPVSAPPALPEAPVKPAATAPTSPISPAPALPVRPARRSDLPTRSERSTRSAELPTRSESPTRSEPPARHETAQPERVRPAAVFEPLVIGKNGSTTKKPEADTSSPEPVAAPSHRSTVAELPSRTTFEPKAAPGVAIEPERTPSALPKRIPAKPQHRVPFGVQTVTPAVSTGVAPADGSERVRSLFEPIVPAEGGQTEVPPPPNRLKPAGAAPASSPAVSTRPSAPGPFGPGSAMPLPGGGSPAPEFTVKASVTALRYCTPESPQFGRTVAEVWFRTAADAERVGFRPVG